MKLSYAVEMDVSEARYTLETVILEDGEGPRWKFRYDNWHNDPSPDILLLGAYRHPATGNNLVGGINLHYINKDQRDKLARSLPQIMQGTNLRERYWTGRELVPEIFTKFYRTYNPRFIRGVSKDVLYPKYGYVKTAGDWLKKKLGAILKTKKQREQDAQPKYPDDLMSMQDRLDQAVADIQTQPQTQDVELDTPEIRAASKAFQDFKREQTLQDIERRENRPMQQAQQEIDRAMRTPGVQDAERDAIEPQQPQIDPKEITREVEATAAAKRKKELEQLAKNNKQANSTLKDVDPDIDIEPVNSQPTDAGSAQRRTARPQQNYEDQTEADEAVNKPSEEPFVDDRLDEPDEPDDQVNESIYYYSPKLRRYIVETKHGIY